MSPEPIRYRFNGKWCTGTLWNHNTGFFGDSEAEVKDDETGEIRFTHEFDRIEVGHA